MKYIEEIELEIVSEMLSHGANKESEAEFRVQELIAAMRYWWRGIFFFEKYNDLLQKENELFGSTEGKAPFSIVLLNSSEIETKIKECNGIIGCIEKTKIWGILPQTKVSLHIIYKDEKEKELYKSLIELVSYLGGLGQRVRRGYGSFKIVKGINNESIEKGKVVEGIKDTIDRIQSNTKQLNRVKYSTNNGSIVNKNKSNKNEKFLIKEIFVGEAMDISNYKSKIREMLSQVKKENENKNEIETFLNATYISCYSEGKEGRVFPVITFFNLKIYSSEKFERYKKYKGCIKKYLGGLHEKKTNYNHHFSNTGIYKK